MGCKVMSKPFAGDFTSARLVTLCESSSSLALLLYHPHREQKSEELAGCMFVTVNTDLEQGTC